MSDSLEKAAVGMLDRLYSFALRLTRDPVEAEDLVQETYVRALQRLDSLRDPGALRTWMFRIMYTVFASGWKNAQRGPVRVDVHEIDDLGRHEIPGTYVPDPREAFFARFLPDEMENAVRKIPEVFRAPLLLQSIEGMSYDEISAVLDCPVGTVRSRLARGRAALSAELRQFAQKQGYVEPEETQL